MAFDAELTVDGVPLITPVLESIVTPLGRPVALQVATCPPVFPIAESEYAELRFKI